MPIESCSYLCFFFFFFWVYLFSGGLGLRFVWIVYDFVARVYCWDESMQVGAKIMAVVGTSTLHLRL